MFLKVKELKDAGKPPVVLYLKPACDGGIWLMREAVPGSGSEDSPILLIGVDGKGRAVTLGKADVEAGFVRGPHGKFLVEGS